MRLELDRHRADTDGAPIGRAARRGLKGKARTAHRLEQVEQVEQAEQTEASEAGGSKDYRRPSR
jgi:hypothetical protein